MKIANGMRGIVSKSRIANTTNVIRLNELEHRVGAVYSRQEAIEAWNRRLEEE